MNLQHTCEPATHLWTCNSDATIIHDNYFLKLYRFHAEHNPLWCALLCHLILSNARQFYSWIQLGTKSTHRYMVLISLPPWLISNILVYMYIISNTCHPHHQGNNYTFLSSKETATLTSKWIAISISEETAISIVQYIWQNCHFHTWGACLFQHSRELPLSHLRKWLTTHFRNQQPLHLREQPPPTFDGTVLTWAAIPTSTLLNIYIVKGTFTTSEKTLFPNIPGNSPTQLTEMAFPHLRNLSLPKGQLYVWRNCFFNIPRTYLPFFIFTLFH